MCLSNPAGPPDVKLKGIQIWTLITFLSKWKQSFMGIIFQKKTGILQDLEILTKKIKSSLYKKQGI